MKGFPALRDISLDVTLVDNWSPQLEESCGQIRPVGFIVELPPPPPPPSNLELQLDSDEDEVLTVDPRDYHFIAETRAEKLQFLAEPCVPSVWN